MDYPLFSRCNTQSSSQHGRGYRRHLPGDSCLFPQTVCIIAGRIPACTSPDILVFVFAHTLSSVRLRFLPVSKAGEGRRKSGIPPDREKERTGHAGERLIVLAHAFAETRNGDPWPTEASGNIFFSLPAEGCHAHHGLAVLVSKLLGELKNFVKLLFAPKVVMGHEHCLILNLKRKSPQGLRERDHSGPLRDQASGISSSTLGFFSHLPSPCKSTKNHKPAKRSVTLRSRQFLLSPSKDPSETFSTRE